MQNVVLNVKGMSCGHCVNSIEGALKSLGVHGDVNLENGTVTVVYDENKVTLERIIETIEEQGYEV
ncbi:MULTISPECIES: cation transporter [Paenibacillus]|uniref:Copper chaperone CopZ n=1 Tax=Paenibacillus illinoisensis TaxID=59845 RepID=A0A2W0C9F6_9BACL|nr:cation transporter [Paenibacillus illinoisensis]PYY27159.1 Copper chaperone CopZ [Paenibacillus illinoisensis]